MIKKKFDCVEMKQKGADYTAEKMNGLSITEELEYWRLRDQELMEKKNEAATKTMARNHS